MSRQPVGWYLRRLRGMSPREVAWRVRDAAVHVAWSTRQVRQGRPEVQPPVVPDRRFTSTLPAHVLDGVPADALDAVHTAGKELLAGRLHVLGVQRLDLRRPDWFLDPVSGVRSDPARYSFAINHRSADEVGDVKQVWELSRHQYLTQLAAAWYVSGDSAFAERVAADLRSWWRENPFLSGVHWTSGIEVGLRLLSWVWIRRLLDGWPGVDQLFEHDPDALRQLYWHQRYLATLRSKGSSANNHVIAEAAGLLAASSAFPWFDRSGAWRADAAALLTRELANNTFPDGMNSELATEYHRFVAELATLAAVEADAAGAGLGPDTWGRLTTMYDAAAAIVDERCRAPRQGDGDGGRALVLEPPGEPADWSGVLGLGAAVVGARPWWPEVGADLTGALVASVAGRPHPVGDLRPGRRPAHFPDAGLTVLRTVDGPGPEIWCRCDGGPHGFLGIAAHAHADALSVELRVGGVDVFADPGTYCYHGQQRWRRYFRSTVAHNTVELGDRDQAVAGGPFLWLRPADGRVLDVAVEPGADRVHFSAAHDGYRTAPVATGHRRDVTLDRRSRELTIVDSFDVAGVAPAVRMAYHLGPAVRVTLQDHTARLTWSAPEGTAGAAVLDLPAQLAWSVHCGETDPVLGWYSPAFGERVPAYSLLGTAGRLPADQLRSVVRVLDRP